MTLYPASGADIGALSSAAYSKALERKLSELRDGAEKMSHNAMSSSSRDANSEISALIDDQKKSFLSSKRLSSYISRLSNAELTVPVCREDFLHAVRSIKPSVTRSELDHHEALGSEFNDLIP